MSFDTQMTLSALAMAALAVVVPAVLLFFLTRAAAGPGVASWMGGVAGAGLGVYVVLTFMFPDTVGEVRRQAEPPTVIEVRLPDGYAGSFYLFLDSQLGALPSTTGGRYLVNVPASGRALVGTIANLSPKMDLVEFDFRYANGQVAPVVTDSVAGGSQEHMGRSVIHWRPFVGTEAEYQAERRRREKDGTLFDELEVHAEMKGQGSPKTTASPG